MNLHIICHRSSENFILRVMDAYYAKIRIEKLNAFRQAMLETANQFIQHAS